MYIYIYIHIGSHRIYDCYYPPYLRPLGQVPTEQAAVALGRVADPARLGGLDERKFLQVPLNHNCNLLRPLIRILFLLVPYG